MLRRIQRQRREYMCRKALDDRERIAYEKKQKIKAASQGTYKIGIYSSLIFFIKTLTNVYTCILLV